MANDGTVKIGTEIDESGFKSGLSRLGSLAKTGLKATTAAVGAVVTASAAAATGLLALESATEEYRVAQGKLNTAFEAAGLSTEAAKQTYNEFYAILGDTDTATEASQLLAKLTRDEQELSTWTNIAAGVYGTFGDALPIEGLIEAANETAKVGTVTGTLADALNWAGISEDEFNNALARCTTESERNKLIMDTLARTYDEAAAAFQRNNAELIEARNNQAMLDEALSKLGATVSNVKNELSSEFLPGISSLVTAFDDMINGVEGADEAFSEAIQNLVTQLVEKLPEFLSFGLDVIQSILSGLLQNAPVLIDGIRQVLDQLMQAMVELLPYLMEIIPLLISSIAQFVNENLDEILMIGVGILVAIGEGILRSLPSLLGIVDQLIAIIVESFQILWQDIKDIGGNLVSGLWEGIQEKINWLIEQIQGFAASVINSIKGFFGIHSPSDETEWMGEMLDEGLASGIKKGAGKIKDAIKDLDLLGEIENALPAMEQQVSIIAAEMAPAAVYAAPVPDEWSGGSGTGNPNGGTMRPVVHIRFDGDLAQLGRVLGPVIEAEYVRLGEPIT